MESRWFLVLSCFAAAMGKLDLTRNRSKGGCLRQHCLSFIAARWPVIRTVVLPGLLAVMAGLCAMAQGVQHLTVTEPGGMPGIPVLTGIKLATNGVTVTWDGPSGYYQVWQRKNLSESTWLQIGEPTNLTRTATIAGFNSNDFFRVSGPAPSYAGASDCATCHGGILSTVALTAHAGAISSAFFVAEGGQTNPSCLACHSVGYGLTTGFVNTSRTPQLEGVQCENCHGPAANHAANPVDPTVVPQVELAAQDCGGCHSGKYAPAAVAAWHPPFFEDWSASPHATIPPEALASMASSSAEIDSCGRCHSGSARLALIAGQDPAVTLTNDFNVPITCAVCHDPHAQHVWTNALSGVISFTNSLTGNVSVITNNELGPVYTNQLLCALSSTNDFVLTTSDNFTNVYNPDINVCAQCHNDRGSAWTDTSRSPHESPQYNLLLGTVGQLATGPSPGFPSTHSRLERQCAACHMQTTNDSSGHTFEVATYQLCYNCHSDPAGLVQLVTNNIASQIQQTKSYLDLWATNTAAASTNAALAALARQYGTLTWEYTTSGSLSMGAGGPDAAGQALIPDDIKMARFDLYLVLYDGSYGVHNGPYDIELLGAAQSWIESELYQ
ncbi:MAG: cytochrome c family protein [Verrucomicrobiota bacterium]